MECHFQDLPDYFQIEFRGKINDKLMAYPENMTASP